jgi:hypothetical protein
MFLMFKYSAMTALQTLKGHLLTFAEACLFKNFMATRPSSGGALPAVMLIVGRPVMLCKVCYTEIIVGKLIVG